MRSGFKTKRFARPVPSCPSKPGVPLHLKKHTAQRHPVA